MLIEEIKSKLYNKAGKLNTRLIVSKEFINSKLREEIFKLTDFLPLDRNISERVYCIENNIQKCPTCPVTGKVLNWLPTKKAYAKVFGKENIQFIVDKEEKNKKISDSKVKKEKKISEDLLESFKNKNYILLSKEDVKAFIKYKVSKTNNGRKSNFVNHKDKKQNKDLLCSILYFTDNKGFCLDEINWSERFYFIHNDLKEIPKSIKDSNVKATYENFTIGYRNSKISTTKSDKKREIVINELVEQNFEIIKSSENGLDKEKYTLRCKSCNKLSEKLLNNGRWKDVYCSGCYGDIGISVKEKEIVSFLKDLNVKVEENNKTILNGKELDIYLPEYQIAIEFNGILWHSFGSTFPNNIELELENKNNHLNKTVKCEERGIQLIHVFDNEWNTKKDIVKSILKNKLKLSEEKIFARKCEIKEVSSKDKRNFLENNHIQGDCNSSMNLGLFFQEELVSLMTFGKRKITKGEQKMELLRFCNRIYTNVIGGASKLLNQFRKGYSDPLISYADRRYSNGNMYLQLGFTLKHTSKPNYWYTKDNCNLIHRSSFQKHKIVKENTKHLTESQIMYQQGYRKIYDSGNFVFELG